MSRSVFLASLATVAQSALLRMLSDVSGSQTPLMNNDSHNNKQPRSAHKCVLNASTESIDIRPSRDKEAPPARCSTTQKQLLAGLAPANILNGSLIAVMIPFFPVEAAPRGVLQTIKVLLCCFAIGQMLLGPLVGRPAAALSVTACFRTWLVEATGMAVVTTCGYIIASSQFPNRVNTAV